MMVNGHDIQEKTVGRGPYAKTKWVCANGGCGLSGGSENLAIRKAHSTECPMEGLL